MKSTSTPSNSCKKPYPPILLAMFALLVAVLICIALLAVLTRFTDLRPQLPITLGAIGLTAALIGVGLKLARWWAPILLLLPAALGASLYFSVPPWVYLTCFLALVIVFWNAAGERVPLYLTNSRTWAAIDGLIGRDASSFIDLGCGLGGILVYLGRRRPDMTFTGIESAPIPYMISKLRVRLFGPKNVYIRFGDMWAENLGDFDTVYGFLSPQPMSRLYRKVTTEMRPETTFISNSFAVEGQEPDDIIDVEDRRQTRLLIWRR